MAGDGFRDKIIFPGRQKDVESTINIFDVGVLSTNTKVHGEGISNPIMEYMALGKPVLATRCGGNCELLIDGKTGFLVKDGDWENLTNRIIQLLDNSQLALQFGESGCQRIRHEFSLEKMSKNHVALSKAILMKNNSIKK